MIVELEEEMLAAAEDLRFEYAAQLRDELRELRRDLQEIRAGEAPLPAEAGIRDFRRGHALGSGRAAGPPGDRTPRLPDRPPRL